MRLGLVANPSSGRGRHNGAADAARRALLGAGHDVLLVEGAYYEDARACATGLLEDARGLDALVVVGGDGMVHLGLDVVAGTGVPLGLIAVGTGNDIARHLGLPGGDVGACAQVIDDALRGRGRVRELDAIHATRPDGAPVADAHEWSFAVAGFGLDAAVNVRANAMRRPRGESRYLCAIPLEMRDMTPYGYRIVTDAGAWEGEALLLVAANTRYFGGGLDIAPRADPADGLLEIIRLDPVGRLGLLAHLARLRRGAHLGHPGVHCERSRALTVEALEAAPGRRIPPHPMADGEAIADLPLRLEAVPGAVRMLCPAEGPA